ncbi:MAG: hypothetical protein ACI4J7_06970 [Ruminiclostridium sp.]
MREERKKIFSLFVKRLAKNFQPLRDLATAFQNNGEQQQGFIALLFSFCTDLQKNQQKNCECAANLPPQNKCRNQVSNGSSAVALAGGQGGGQPPCYKNTIFFSQNLFSL